MAYYHDDYRGHHHDEEGSEPDDIDGTPPQDSPSHRPQQHWAPPLYRGGPEYYSSPPRGDPRGYRAESPERRGPPAGYPTPEYGRGQPRSGYPPPDYGRGGGPPFGYQPSEYERGPPQGYPPSGYPPPDYERRPPPPDYERRSPPPGYESPEHSRAGPRYNAGAGYPPPPYEPEQRYNAGAGYPPESPRRGPPPMVAYPPPGYAGQGPPRGESPQRPPVNASAGFPPMPYEPAGGQPPPGPPAGYSDMPHDRPHDHPVDASAGFPPMPYEPGAPSPERPQYNPNEGYPPQGPPREEERGKVGTDPFNMSYGYPPPPFQEGHYGGSKLHEHGHLKRRHFAGCKDYWASFLFLLHFWAVVGLCIYLGVRGVIKTNQTNSLVHRHALAPAPAPPLPGDLYSIRNWAPQLAAAAGSGWLFALIWQHLLRLFPTTMIYVCLYTGAGATGLLGIILISTGTAKGLLGLIFLVSALFQGLYVHLVRHRIPFAAIMLTKALLVVHKYKGLYLISIWSVFMAMFWLAVWIFGVSGVVSLPYGGYYVVLLIISLAWTMEVFRNVVHVTVAGVVGTFYFQEHHMPLLPVLTAYRRAWTISFGSICLGSMFAAIVQSLHAVAKRLANEQGENEFFFSCVNCFLGLLQMLIRYFNKWAYVQVALYGKSFVTSAKDTWFMFQNQGAELLINDDLTVAVLLTGCIVGGVLTALVGGCWTFAKHRYLTVGVSIISFFIGFFVTYLTTVVAESAVATYYVCFVEDPATLEKHDPPTFQYMSERKLKLDQEAAE